MKRTHGPGFGISGELWAKVEPLLPPCVNTHRFGGGRPRRIAVVWTASSLSFAPAARPRPRWRGGSSPNPTDRAKQGTKRSLLVEAAGVPVAVVVAGANRNVHPGSGS